MNPAITLALFLFRGFPGRKVLGYCVAQIFGGFVGAVIVYGCFISSLNRFDGGIRQWEGEKATSAIFYVHPRPDVTFTNHFLSEFIGTLLLMAMVCAVTDRHNNYDSDMVIPIVFGFTATCILVALGMRYFLIQL